MLNLNIEAVHHTRRQAAVVGISAVCFDWRCCRSCNWLDYSIHNTTAYTSLQLTGFIARQSHVFIDRRCQVFSWTLQLHCKIHLLSQYVVCLSPVTRANVLRQNDWFSLKSSEMSQFSVVSLTAKFEGSPRLGAQAKVGWFPVFFVAQHS